MMMERCAVGMSPRAPEQFRTGHNPSKLLSDMGLKWRGWKLSLVDVAAANADDARGSSDTAGIAVTSLRYDVGLSSHS